MITLFSSWRDVLWQFPYCNEIVFIVDTLIIVAFTVVMSRFGKTGLTAFVAISWILANFLVQKEVVLFGQEVVTSDSFTIGFNSALLLVLTHYGEKAARSAITVSCILISFFLIVTQMHVAYAPSLHDVTHCHYAFLFDPLLRIMIVSLCVAYCSSRLNLVLFSVIQRAFPFLTLSVAQFSALVVSQVVDTVLFAFLALYGTVNSITSIIIFSSSIKIIAIGFNIFFLSLVQRYLSKPCDIV